ncbi:MAG: hypothetical protein FJ279_13445 [Planctomycetes bacterium]|nr:hypothetical protein [Planctomycetota bacterium]
MNKGDQPVNLQRWIWNAMVIPGRDEKGPPWEDDQQETFKEDNCYVAHDEGYWLAMAADPAQLSMPPDECGSGMASVWGGPGDLGPGQTHEVRLLFAAGKGYPNQFEAARESLRSLLRRPKT